MRKGFQGMTPERRREVAASGGRAAHAKGTAHRWTEEEAREAGRKGGWLRTPKGFAAMDPDAHITASRTGGSATKRGSR